MHRDASFPAVASSTSSYSDFKGYPRQRKLERMALQELKAEVAVERMRFVEGFLKRHCAVTDGVSNKFTAVAATRTLTTAHSLDARRYV
jgi:hypothetical protein